uniref:G-protein coupled receptors family 1 profile domain-containing protein n=1 Tax=Calidris pygmaea TaxID=425635 RepID=A0A8C3KTH9_9CHAR
MDHENYTVVTEFVLVGLSQTHEIQMILFFFFLLFYMIILACMAQLFFLHFLGAAEAFLLMVMAYDRYIAICKPLHYNRLVNRGICHVLVGATWGGGFIRGVILFALSIHLPLCGPNILDNFCDVHQLVKLACTNTYTVELLMFLNNGVIIIMCFTLPLISYTVLHVWPSCIYIRFTLPSYPKGKIVAVFHMVIFTLTNPMIYTFHNKEIKGSMWKLVILEMHQCSVDWDNHLP